MTASVTRRGAIVAFVALAFAPVRLDEALAASGFRVAGIHVDRSRLRALRADPTARWVEDELPESVARARPALCVGAPGGAVLNVHVDDVLLQSMRGGATPRIVD